MGKFSNRKISNEKTAILKVSSKKSRLKVWSVIKKSALIIVGIKKSRLKIWSVLKKSAVKKVGKK